MRSVFARTWLAGACVAALTPWVAAPSQADTSVQDTLMSVTGSMEMSFDPHALALLGLKVSDGATGPVAIGSESSLELIVVNEEMHEQLVGELRASPGAWLETAGGVRIAMQNVSLAAAHSPDLSYEFTLRDADSGRALFYVAGSNFEYDPRLQVFSNTQAWLRVTEELAGLLHDDSAAGDIVGQISFYTAMDLTQQTVVEDPVAADPIEPTGGTRGAGPDVVYTDCTSTSNYGNIGGIRAYALGSNTCNIGNLDLLWTNNGTPGLAMNLYRLYGGRMEQIGQSWVKHACCAAAGNGCGLACNGRGGSVLGAGCLDVYSSGWNGGQGRLGARSGINAFTGSFSPLPGGSGNAIFRRLQVLESDLSATNFPGALYFVEGVYVGSDDVAAQHMLNNASYKRVTINAAYDLVLAGAMQRYDPAIKGWRANGNGVGVVDPRVTDVIVDVPNEGRFHAATKVADLGNGNWRYDYAIFNLTSDRSGGSFAVPLGPATTITNVGFHDVFYHSGEPYDNTDWVSTVRSTDVTWTSPQSFAQNPNSNALRWGTMYNFWFESNRPPTQGMVTLGLFKPHNPQSVQFEAPVPTGGSIPGDLDRDGDVDLQDLGIVLSDFGCTGGPLPPCRGDADGDGDTDLADVGIVLANYGS